MSVPHYAEEAEKTIPASTSSVAHNVRFMTVLFIDYEKRHFPNSRMNCSKNSEKEQICAMGQACDFREKAIEAKTATARRGW